MSNRHNNFQKQSNENFFIQLLKAWLHFINNNFPTPKSIKEILEQTILLNSHTKLDFSSDNPYFYCISPRNILGKFIIIRNLLIFLQPGLTYSTKFDEKLGFPTVNHKKICKLVYYRLNSQ